jgi:CheY-like chemotaxis protein
MARADHELSLSLPQEPAFLHADPVRLGQVFTSVLSNAARHTPRGGRIDVMAERVGTGVRVSVQDNGIGILPDKLRQIFESSDRQDDLLKTDYKAFRSGLTLVKSVVEMHGGTVMARSDGLGRGSMFIVWLPIEIEADASAPSSEPRESDAGSLRVLLVDDNRELTLSMTRFIRTLGHEVFVAFDGARALQLASEVRPQVALMDIGLPDLNGYEVARLIRMKPWGATMTIVAITGQGKERQRSYEAGFDLHLTKPVDPGALEAFLSTCVRPRSAIIDPV